MASTLQYNEANEKPALRGLFIRPLDRLLDRARRLGLAQGRCRICGGPRRESGFLCPDCARQLAPRQGGFCPQCGQLYGDPLEPAHLCGDCLRSPEAHAWDNVLFYGEHTGLLREMLIQFKFSSRLGYGSVLRSLAARAYGLRLPFFSDGDEPAHDLAAPIPLHRSRLLWRGFNQSLELARAVARSHAIPLDAGALVRNRATRPQVGLSRAERLANCRGAFTAAPERVAGKRVLLVDDILTTGSTMHEAARTLKKAGAERVDALVVARAPVK